MTEAWNGRPPAPLDQVWGWHWIGESKDDVTAVMWSSKTNLWNLAEGINVRPEDIKRYASYYISPWLTPSQVEAQIAEAVKAEREKLGVNNG